MKSCVDRIQKDGNSKVILHWINADNPATATYTVSATYNNDTSYKKALTATGDMKVEQLLEDYLKVGVGARAEA